MLKYFATAVVIGSMIAFPGAASAQKDDSKLRQKCSQEVRKVIPDPNNVQNKRQAGALFKKCMSNGGKL